MIEIEVRRIINSGGELMIIISWIETILERTGSVSVGGRRRAERFGRLRGEVFDQEVRGMALDSGWIRMALGSG